MFENNYLTLYTNSGFNDGSFTGLITVFLLAFCRIIPILAFAPFLGGKVLPKPVKVGLALALSMIFFPTLSSVTSRTIAYNSYTWVLVIKELMIGYMLGILSTIPSFVVQGAGMFIDHQRGGSSLQVNDPLLQNQASPIGTLYDLVYVYMFWLIDGPFIFLEAIRISFEIVPPDQLLSAQFFNQENPFWKDAIELYNMIMKMMVQIASPSLIIILMTETFLGIANRLAPNVMITFLGMPLKSFLGLFIMWVGWKLVTAAMIEFGFKWHHELKAMIQAFGLSG